MAAYKLRCPNCGANLKPSPGASTTVCEYCGTTSQIKPEDKHIADRHKRRADSAYPEPPKTTDYYDYQTSDLPTAVAYKSNSGLYLFIAITVMTVLVFGFIAVISNQPTGPRQAPVAKQQTPTTPPKEAPKPPPKEVYEDLKDKLEPLIADCLNQVAQETVRIRYDYVDLAGSGNNLRRNQRIRVSRIADQEIARCEQALTSSRSSTAKDPELDRAAEEFIAAVKALPPLLDKAFNYYDNDRYLDDRWAEGVEMHPALLEDLGNASLRAIALHDEIQRVFEEVTGQMRTVQREKQTEQGTPLFDSLLAARDLALMASPIGWRQISTLEEASLRSSVQYYDDLVQGLERNAGFESSLLSYKKELMTSAQTMLRLRMGTTRFSSGDRMFLNGGSSYTMVDGAPENVVYRYNQLMFFSRNAPITLPYILHGYLRIEESKAQARPTSAGTKTPVTKQTKAPAKVSSLPEHPSREEVVRIARSIDLSKCKSTGLITINIAIRPDSVATLTRLSTSLYKNRNYLRDADRCVRDAFSRLRFPESQKGIQIQGIEIVAPGPLSDLPPHVAEQLNWVRRCPGCK